MDKIAVNAFIHGGALSDPIELNPYFVVKEEYLAQRKRKNMVVAKGCTKTS